MTIYKSSDTLSVLNKNNTGSLLFGDKKIKWKRYAGRAFVALADLKFNKNIFYKVYVIHDSYHR